ncbi:hypothetical protein PESP_b0357 [Pseudoalteromonas espejiana DSM 9414]|nr:hypothetical protein PESP_b0357 [Pseudoalteromonas espejiana DSM 9414]
MIKNKIMLLAKHNLVCFQSTKANKKANYENHICNIEFVY